MTAYYDSKPAAIEAVGNGSYRYRFNIEEVVAEVTEDNIKEEKASQWRCEEVTVWAPLSANKITQRVISEKWDADTEQKLINEYNAVQLGIITDNDEAAERTEAYRAFLTERTALKQQIDADCELYDIRHS